jgi:uncharacterized coiled-coil protein SlyX
VSATEVLAALSERISKLERQISSHPSAIIAELKESIADHEQQLKSLNGRISALEPNLTTDLKEFKLASPRPVSTPTPLPPVSPSKALKTLEFPLRPGKSFDGIIAYLTRRHGGNVYDKGIVRITAKSVDRDGPLNFAYLADLAADSCFGSKSEPGQWVCWDFQDMRLRPTHYTGKSGYPALKSWLIESSLDGKAWIEIDRKPNNYDFPGTASFAVSKLAECRFIRLTQTGKNREGTDSLQLRAIEFFGSLIE